MDKNIKKLSLISAILLLAGGMIGSAIFSLSGLTIFYAGPSAVLSWTIAALIQLFFGLAMAELATRYSKNGGLFVFPEQTFKKHGELIGFISTWGNAFTDITAIAFSAIYVSIYLSVSFPNLSKYSTLISIGVILFCLILNYLNISSTGKFNTILVIAFAVILLSYVFLVFTSDACSFSNLSPFFTQGSKGAFGFLTAIPIAMIGFTSIMAISAMAGDIENPKKNIPIAVVAALFIVMALYVIVIFATVTAITSKELVDTDSIYIPLFAVCTGKLKNVPIFSHLIVIAAVFALVTTILVIIATDGRTIKAIADNGLLPSPFKILGKNGTPIFAMTVVSLIAMILTIFSDFTMVIVNLAALFSIITIIITFITLYFSRKNSKDNENVYRAPLNPFFIFLLILIMISCYMPDILKGGYLLWLITIIWDVIGIVIFTMNKRSR